MMQGKPKAHILYVEDDMTLGFVTKDNLENYGYQITHMENGLEALESLEHNVYDLCILDVMLPLMDGFTLAEKIREKDKHIPVLFLTAKSLTEDKIRGLSLGGDDYITKPFHIDELVLKIEVFLRRNRVKETVDETTREMRIGRYLLDAENMLLKGPNSEGSLTYKEAELLKYLNENRDKVLKRQDILVAVWGDDSYMLSRSLDVFISRLRRLLADDPGILIRSVHGIGFRFQVKERK